MKIVLRTFGICLLASVLAPAADDVSGNWNLTVKMERGYSGQPKISLKQDRRKLEGKYTGPMGESPVSGSIEGKEVTFTVRSTGTNGVAESEFKGTFTAPDTMAGTVRVTRGGNTTNGKWEAKRE